MEPAMGDWGMLITCLCRFLGVGSLYRVNQDATSFSHVYITSLDPSKASHNTY